MQNWSNLVTMFFDQAASLKDKPFLWAKQGSQYQSRSWAEVAGAVSALARGLRDLGIVDGDRVVLVSENRPEWLIAEVAIMAAGAIPVPAYTTNTVNDHAHILGNSGAKGAIVSTAELAERLIPAAHAADAAKFVISIEPLKQTQSVNADLLLWSDVLDRGRTKPDDIAERLKSIQRRDLAVIIYTSGTGGAPKGVMLSHGAILHNCAGAEDALQEIGLDDEVFLSFLPLSHSYEHTAGQFFPISIGAQIYYAESVEHLGRNFKEARPTIMTAVPRLYELMHVRIAKGVRNTGGTKEKLFNAAVDLGRRKIETPGTLSFGDKMIDALVDKLVRRKVKANFGGRLKAFVSGGAPLNYDIGMFFSALGLRLLQGYGLTESAPVISVTRPSNNKLATVGPPLLDTEVKIAEDGEILVRGELVMQGYWQNPEATREVIRDGWLHTGDVGKLDEDGYIQITDRKKDIIVNSGGDNLSPQRVEGFLTLQPEISQAMVYGDKRPHLVAGIVPDPDFAAEWAKGRGVEPSIASLAANEEFVKTIGSAVERVNSTLNNIERVRRFCLIPDPFTVENEMMTPSLKVRRFKVTEVYGQKLEALYGKPQSVQAQNAAQG